MLPCCYLNEPRPIPKPSPFQDRPAYPTSGCDSPEKWLDNSTARGTLPIRGNNDDDNDDDYDDDYEDDDDDDDDGLPGRACGGS